MVRRNIFLLLGSNSGDRAAQLTRATELIEREVGIVITRSKRYETAPWGKSDQPDFLNQVLRLESPLTPVDLLFKVQEIEQTLGRTPTVKWGERSIDIDILYFDDTVIDIPGLTVPHAHLAERRFVLVPLAEISPAFVHPLLRKTNLELLTACEDPLSVKEFRG